VIDAPAVLFASHLFDLASVWNVVRGLLTLSKRCVASRSSRLAPTFVPYDLIFISSKVYIFTCVTNVLVHFALDQTSYDRFPFDRFSVPYGVNTHLIYSGPSITCVGNQTSYDTS
jgi:hypothetical protein